MATMADRAHLVLLDLLASLASPANLVFKEELEPKAALATPDLLVFLVNQVLVDSQGPKVRKAHKVSSVLRVIEATQVRSESVVCRDKTDVTA